MHINPFATIKDIRAALSKRKISREDVLDFFVERFDKYNKSLNAALEIFDSKSILDSSSKTGLLGGVPGLLKDNISQKGRKLTCASKILGDFVSPYDSTATKRLKKEGALIVGRANCDEFAMGTSGEESAFGPTANPWDASCVAGGSSSGSVAAVAAGLVPWALGSETGGSVRLPAAFCGVVGLKPTYGLISRYGLVAYASSLDQIGIATRTVYDNALVLSAIAGHDEHDSTTRSVESQNYTDQVALGIKKGLRIGVIDNALHAEGLDSEIKNSVEIALEKLKTCGAQVTNVTLPSMDYAMAAYFIISRAEAASNLARFDGVRYGWRYEQSKNLLDMYSKTRGKGFGKEVRQRIMVGNYVLSSGHRDEYYICAKKFQQLLRNEFEEQFKAVDVLVMPTHALPAFKFNAFEDNKLALDLQDSFTCPVNLAGIPALSVPCGFTQSGLPIGFQLIGPWLSEALLYQVAYAYEQNTSWHEMYPKNFK